MTALRRAIQALCFILFLAVLAACVFGGYSGGWADMFLRMDPALVGLTALAGRVWLAGFWPALAVLASALFLGRAFCGYVCPLGATLDGARPLIGPKKRPRPKGPGPLWLKYLVLAALVGAGAAGVGLVFWASPLSLATRFYGLLIHPVLMLAAEAGLTALRPLAEAADLTSLLLAQVKPPRYAAQIFVLAFFAGAFALAWIAPRAWCRWLCPAGALLGLCSAGPLIQRRVSDKCNQCGLCAEACPMGAIPGDRPEGTRRRECQLCFTCQSVCPQGAVSFGPPVKGPSPKAAPDLPSRRGFIKAGAGGVGLAVVGLSGLGSPLGTQAPGAWAAPGLVRPPGSLPESAFLSQCVRCGQCMAICPRNALQPVWLESGWLGLFSPALVARRGYCDPACNRCGRVCPTGAIRPLGLDERRWARPGMAVINRSACLAWEQNKSCMVCDEVCPYKAISFQKPPGAKIAAPYVMEERCAGCGSCEHYCPVKNRAAIVVTPMGALRLAKGSFMDRGKSMGLNISLKQAAGPGEAGAQGAAPGFTD